MRLCVRVRVRTQAMASLVAVAASTLGLEGGLHTFYCDRQAGCQALHAGGAVRADAAALLYFGREHPPTYLPTYLLPRRAALLED